MKQPLKQLFFGLSILSFSVALFFDCSATHTLTQDPRLIEDVGNGKYEQISDLLKITAEKGKFKEKDIVLYYLNQGMLQHYAGNYEKSNEYLSLAERKIEDLFTKSISRISASFLLNDNVLDYSGEDYEDIYLNVFKALNYIHLGMKDHAFVEINRIQTKLRQLTDKYVDFEKQISSAAKAQKKGTPPETEIGTINFHNSVLARYLSMLLYLTDNEIDRADIDRRKIKEAWITQPSIYTHEMPAFIDDTKIINSNLQIIAFTGFAPAKLSSDYYITTLYNALNITSTSPKPFTATVPWFGMEPNYHFKFSIPYMAGFNSRINRIIVEVDGEFASELELLESLEKVAIETFEIKASLIYFKTLARTVAKGIAAAEAKKEIDRETAESSDPDYIAAFLAKVAIDVAMDLTENADLRTSMFFPSKALAASLTLEPGMHDVSIIYLNHAGEEIHSELYKQMNIQSNQMSFIETYYLK